jgi:hypothetical protein
MDAEGRDRDQANLEKIDHVVVVMLENRSFDHMLGYLSLDGRRPNIDGLQPGLANDYQGQIYPVHDLDTTTLEMDPDHSATAIDVQVAGGTMGGFVASAAATLASRGVQGGDPSCVMGYYDGADVPVYDHLVSSSPSVTAGSARCRAPPCPTVYMPCVAGRREVGTTGRPISRPYTISPPSSATSTPMASPGAGIPSTRACCAPPTFTTGLATTTGSATSARPGCHGAPGSI